MSELGFEGFTASGALEGLPMVNLEPPIAPREPKRHRKPSGRHWSSAKADGPGSMAACAAWNEQARNFQREDSVSMRSCALSDSYLLDVERGKSKRSGAKAPCK